MENRQADWHASSAQRVRRGRVASVAGLLAEDAVAACYLSQGCQVLARRWRGQAGEIDLICRQGDTVIFVEVKAGPDHARAAARLNRSQMNRICRAAGEFCDCLPTGSLTEMRFDAALVDGAGRVDLIPNAFGGG